MNSLAQFKHVHIIGVCGTLMGAFASYLRRAGIRVTGSDQNIYPPMSDVLKNAGVEMVSPYEAANLEKIGGKPDLVVVGNVISKNNAEMAAFAARGDTYVSLPEFMEKHLLPNTRNLVVAGTHGKTTTSSLLAHTLTDASKSGASTAPSYFIGGVSHTLPHSFNVESNSKYFVLEGDEYDTAYWDKVPKFNHYLPNDVILTSIEYDHADIYPDLQSVKNAFNGLLTRIRKEGILIACVETENVREAIAKWPARKEHKVITYSRHRKDEADFSFDQLARTETGIKFRVVDQSGKAIEELEIQLPGEHNALNALAVYIECKELGISSDLIRKGLASFEGVKRRQEERGEVKGVLVIDDFAHHPTAVRETLNALKMKYPKRRLLTVFEPRSATSRRKVFQKDYTEAFDASDETLVAVAFDVSKIAAADQFSSEELVAGLQDRGKKADFFREVDDGVKAVAKAARSGDLVAVLSNGGFGGFIPKLLEALKG
jgi:UDP-N-acetylmuramate: L-alanyl-gamma-D-glutamyl-meso-diaminopimelate ligase